MSQTHTLYPLSVLAVCSVLLGSTGHALAIAADGEPAGQVVARSGGKTITLPLLKSDYAVSIDGTVATVTLKQTFFNAGSQALNATYLFPLNQKAAAYAMTMEVGDETVNAVIQRKEEAEKTFAQAQAEGKTAALLDQHRPNMFSQNIANLMPQMPVTITLKYVQKVARNDNAYELVVPMVVGPRYEGPVPQDVAEDLGFDRDMADREPEDYQSMQADHAVSATPASQQTETVSGWNIAKLPAYPAVIGHDAPGDIDPKRVSFDLKLRSANPIYNIYSGTHPLVIDAFEHEASARLADGRTIDNRDLVLRYELGDDDDVTAGALSHFDQRGGVVSLQIEPPKVPAEETVTPRELVFVLDTSGSMSGDPMEASKRFMRAALGGLRPDDHFRILRFSNNTSQFAQNAMPATPANIRDGMRFVNSLSAGGGTEMNNAINAAFDLPQPANTLRLVVFLTDGYIGADRQVISTVGRRIGNARIYAFGIGNAVNRFLLEGLAREGRGRARYVEVGENAAEVAEAFATDLDAPLLTDISIDWNGLDVDGQVPARIPDLFAGNSLNVMARYKTGGPHTVTVKGLVNGRPASMPVKLDLPETPSENESALPVIWAREQVFDLEREYTLSGGNDTRAREAITRLGLDYSLQTAFTSFIAVSEKIYNETPAATQTAAVPLPQVSGVTTNAYPSLNLSGSSTPEPEALFGLMAALMLVLARFRKSIRLRFSAMTGIRSPRAIHPAGRMPGLPNP